MKKTILLASLAVFIFSCGNNNSNTNGSTNANGTNANGTSTTAPAKTDPEVDKGLALVGKNDCFTCHKIAEQSVGPAYQKVAEKYTATPEVIDTLAQKVIRGGSGNWGTVPMTPHQNLSKEDAQAMVKYVLSLKP